MVAKGDSLPVGGGNGSAPPNLTATRRRRLRRRTVALVALFVFAGAVALAFQDTRLWVAGAWNGDRFFAHRPTTYWAERLNHHKLLSKDPFIDELAKGGKEAVPVLTELQRSPNPVVRAGAARALAAVVADHAEAVAALAKALGDEDESVRFAAVPDTIGAAKNDPEILRLLVKLAASLSTQRADPRREFDSTERVPVAVRVGALLASYGPVAKAAVPAVENWLPFIPLECANEIAAIRAALRAIDPAAADRIVAPDGWWRGFEKMQLLDGDSILGVRMGELIGVRNGKWDATPRVKLLVHDFVVAPKNGGQLHLLRYENNEVSISLWPGREGNFSGPPKWKRKWGGDAVSATSDGALLVTSDMNGNGGGVFLIDGATGAVRDENVLPRQFRSGGVHAEQFSPVGRELAVGLESQGGKYEVIVLSTEKWETRLQMKTIVRPNFLEFSPDGARLAVAGELATTIEIFETATGRSVTRFSGGCTQIRPVFCNGSKWVASLSGGNNVITLRDADTGRTVKELNWHRNEITALAVSDDGRRVASCDRRGWVRIWDLTDLGR